MLLALAAQGPESNDEARLIELLGDHPVRLFRFNRSSRRQKSFSAVRLLATLLRNRSDLVVMEGTGVLAGVPLLVASCVVGCRFIVSTGDAVGPYVAGRSRLLGPFFALYERALYRFSAGVIAWTPYLAGRALTFGAPRTITLPGWANHQLSADEAARARKSVRDSLGIAGDSLVIGIVGSLNWSRRHRYCYGAELVRAVATVKRKDVVVLVVGGGSGFEHLVSEGDGASWLRMTGPVGRAQVGDYLAAMDLASLPQTLDTVGSFRYSTKLPEYLAAALPVVTGQLPLAYDLGLDAFFRLPGKEPWSDQYIKGMALLLDRLRPESLRGAALAAAHLSDMFTPDEQKRRLNAFITDILCEPPAPNRL